MSVLRRLFAVRSVDSIVQDLNSAPPLKRVLTARSLTAIGLGVHDRHRHFHPHGDGGCAITPVLR